MSPRAYRLGERQSLIDQTRGRIIDAARSLLMASSGFTSFTIDAVARQADVSRMTVYYQFGSKIGLLEALSDALAQQGGMEQLAQAFRQPNSQTALRTYIRIFSQFWDSDRLVTRRLRGLAALDSEFEQVVRARDERRRHGLRTIVERAGGDDQVAAALRDEVIDVLYTLTSFETFDTLAGTARSCVAVAPIIQRQANAELNRLLQR